MTRRSRPPVLPPAPARALATLAPAALLLAACSSAPAGADELRAVWLMQDQLDDGGGRLAFFLHSEHPNVRARAARALGAVGGPTAPNALRAAADDPDPDVRREALAALGRVSSPRQVELLSPFTSHPEAELRALAADGLGRSGDARALPLVLPLLGDHEANVRGAAALATLRLAGDRIRGQARELPDGALDEATAALLQALTAERDERARWQTVYAVAHLVRPMAAPALQQVATDEREGRWARLFALRGLSALQQDPEVSRFKVRELLVAALAESDPALAYETARGLAPATPAPSGSGEQFEAAVTAATVAALTGGLRAHASPHVRAAAATALGNRAETAASRAAAAAALREALQQQLDAEVRAAALPAVATLLGDAAADVVLEAMDAADWRLRVAAARAVAHLTPLRAMPLLQQLAGDPDVRVRTAALEALPAAKSEPTALLALQDAAKDRDLALRETLGPTAEQLGDARAVPALRDAFDDSPGLELAEARKLMLRAAVALAPQDPVVRVWLRRALHDPEYVVRAEAAKHLRRQGESVADEVVGRRSASITPLPGREVPWQLLQSRPSVRFTTEKGEFTIELRPDAAPMHVFNLLQLVRRGDYDGRIVHRVVPNFVVQGGDRRGDGFGAEAWHGRHLRDEIDLLPFDAGVVGMPKTEDPHTGGDQFFVTTVPTPHLDGRYTAFGVVVDGQEVVERLQVGDVILRTVELP